MAAAANNLENEECANEFSLFLLLEAFGDGVLNEEEFIALYFQEWEARPVKINLRSSIGIITSI